MPLHIIHCCSTARRLHRLRSACVSRFIRRPFIWRRLALLGFAGLGGRLRRGCAQHGAAWRDRSGLVAALREWSSSQGRDCARPALPAARQARARMPPRSRPTSTRRSASPPACGRDLGAPEAARRIGERHRTELDACKGKLRAGASSGIASLRRRVVRAIDFVLDLEGAVAPSEATRPRASSAIATTTIASLASPAIPLQIVRELREATVANVLDGPRELRSKADLLRDSPRATSPSAKHAASRAASTTWNVGATFGSGAGALDEDMFGEDRVRRRRIATASNGSSALSTTPS